MARECQRCKHKELCKDCCIDTQRSEVTIQYYKGAQLDEGKVSIQMFTGIGMNHEKNKKLCAARESNPGRKNGNLAWYHYTSSANVSGDAGDWTRDLSHAKRTLYHWATSPCSYLFILLGNWRSDYLPMIQFPKTIDLHPNSRMTSQAYHHTDFDM